jgi:hypothetical protein
VTEHRKTRWRYKAVSPWHVLIAAIRLAQQQASAKENRDFSSNNGFCAAPSL